ncbi:MAG: PKD domain-containing protein, partial [Williamsia herbipolensis]|nr:PKD domain-containing protein [Williamsia herbipolensis]
KPGSSGATKLAVTPTSKTTSTRTGSEVSPTLATFVAAKGASASKYSATIDWGDGTTSAGTLSAGQLNSYSVRGSHTYAKPGWYRVAVTVTDGKQSAVGYAGIDVAVAATGGITPGFDGTCIADDGVQADCDGGGYSYSRQALEAAGAPQGKSLDVPGTDLHFTLPAVAAGTPDNAKGSGQTVPVDLPKDATKIAFVGAGTEGNQTSTATLKYSDGSTQSVPLNFPDWTLGGGGSVPSGYTSVAATQYRLDEGGRDGAKPYLFAAAPITLESGKTLAGVVMPKQPGTEKDQGRVHVFSIADNGTAPAALTTKAGADATATTGTAASVKLASASGGTGTRTARVQWGDASQTADATVSADGVVTGSHTWTKPGTYTVHVTVSDPQTSVTSALTVTVADKKAQTLSVADDSLSPGNKLTVTGTGFEPGERVALSLATPSADRTTVTADSSGRVKTTLAVPSSTRDGRYAITAVGTRTKLPATATVGVENKALSDAAPRVRSTLVLSSNTATPGERVTASGTG